MLTPMDDYPVHQTSHPIAHPVSGDPNHYDRYFFNGYRDDMYFGVAMGHYPNRGVIDAAFALVYDGKQRSIFASGRIPTDRTVTEIGPLSIDVVEPLRVSRVTVDAAELGVTADLTFTARTAALEEPHQTILDGTRTALESTRLTQWGSWSGSIEWAGTPIDIDAVTTYGSKDRSWGVRAIGQPAPSAPSNRQRQVMFLWAPINFETRCTHAMLFEGADGDRWVSGAAEVPILSGPNAPTWGPDAAVDHLPGGDIDVAWEPGLRRSRSAKVTLHHLNAASEGIALDPLLTFRMRGLGYGHPVHAHGTWLGEDIVHVEEHSVDELDSLDPTCIHVQQVVRATATSGDQGIGVLEQLAIGPHSPSGLTGILDGYTPLGH